jgi:hypothetical protein
MFSWETSPSDVNYVQGVKYAKGSIRNGLPARSAIGAERQPPNEQVADCTK